VIDYWIFYPCILWDKLDCFCWKIAKLQMLRLSSQALPLQFVSLHGLVHNLCFRVIQHWREWEDEKESRTEDNFCLSSYCYFFFSPAINGVREITSQLISIEARCVWFEGKRWGRKTRKSTNELGLGVSLYSFICFRVFLPSLKPNTLWELLHSYP
jgi:hypothetical protein